MSDLFFKEEGNTMAESKDIFTKCRHFLEPQKVKSQGLYPYFRTIEATEGTQVVCQGRRKIMIGSNNYLGLAHDPRVLEAAQHAVRKFGAGCTGSRFLNGNMLLHDQLESELADFLDRPAVVLFSTGVFANLGSLLTLCESGDFILSDRENHASIIDGALMSQATMVPFSHNSSSALERRLKRIDPNAAKLLVVDGVFSMSGDIIDLPAMQSIAKKYGARTYVDEAHSLGVLGPHGQGSVAHFGLNNEVDIIMGTFSKSLGSMGGFIAADEDVINYLKHKARCLIFTASLAPAVVGGVLKALQILRAEPERRELLWKNTHKMHEGFRQIGFNIGTTQTPIVPLLIGSESKAFLFCQKLFDAGVFATPAIYPAVRYGQAIVRTSYMASHRTEELDYVLETCEKLARSVDIFSDPAYQGKGNKEVRTGDYDFAVQDGERVEPLRVDSGAVASPESEFYPPLSR